MIRKFLRSVIERFPNIAHYLRNSRDLLKQYDLPKDTPWGFSLAGNETMAAGMFEPQETKIVRNLLQEIDMLVNVGANVGYYCCHALSIGKPVIAIEPIARNLQYLLRNIHNNGGANRAEVFPVAIGRDTDILQMWGGGTGASIVKGWASNPQSYVTQVPVLSLDRVIGSKLNGLRALILADIEGAELMMLQGATKILNNTPRPIWMIEISTTEHQPVGIAMNPNFLETFEIFFNCGYRSFTADDLACEVTKEIILDVIAGNIQPGTHNFIFRVDKTQ